MTIKADPQLDTSDWEVPTRDEAVFAPRAHSYALVIPVINEGERIRGQLERIAAAAPEVDVIIADGGSTDGSLDAAFLQSVNVRALLTKTGPGKLSAQLRMAYAWCLEQGYAGIVTMDGNGKDGVEAIAAMVEKLDDGCDYVQGSRYLSGGAAENTPLERTIANRGIHAPLLSLAGKHVFTDTTNGFRAYSARYLTHPDVRPFRDEFQVYGLLFYLTVRAGQLGLKVSHLPVTRTYPESGKVPTKIGGLSSKLALLGETVFAATGGYTPNDIAPRKQSQVWPLIALLAITLPLLLSLWAMPPYSPDSWALYELSKTVFGDFYRFEHFRSYSGDPAYSSAFPPLFPTLIAVIDGLFGTGARTGLYLAFASFVGFAIASECLGRRVAGTAWIGLGAALVLLLGPSMMLTEMGAGRTIPLQMLLYALVLFCLAWGRDISWTGSVTIGVLAGLAVLNRFDAILLPLLSAGIIVWLTRRPALGMASLAVSLVVVLPWIAYSLATFGTLFATDNSGIATSLDPSAFVTDWWPDEQPDWRDDPGAWLSKVAANIGSFFVVLVTLVLTPTGLAGVLAIGAVLAFGQLASRRPDAPKLALHLPTELRPLLGFAAICVLLMAPQIVTGYIEYRYFTALFWAAGFVALAWIVMRAETIHQRLIFGKLGFAVIFVFVAGLSLGNAARAISDNGMSEDTSPLFDRPVDVALLQSCMSTEPDARILVLGDDNLAARAGALAGLHTMMEPRNMARGQLDRDASLLFVETFDVDYVLIADPDRKESALAKLELAPLPACPLMLFRIIG